MGEFSISQKNSPITDNHAETNRGDFFTLSRNPPITSLEIGANWVKNAHIPIFPQTILKKGQKLLGKYIEIRKIPQ